MWPGQPPGHRVDAEADVDALVAQAPGELGDRVLGLGHGHAVAGRDDHARRAGEQLGDALGVDLAVLAVVLLARPTGASMPKPPAITEMNERFIALHMM